VAETGQPYAFTGDDPLNATDPLGLTAGPARPPKSVCANSGHKRSCEAAVKKEESCGRLGCRDAKEAHKALPEAIGVGLFVTTGGVGDLIEALGTSADVADAATSTNATVGDLSRLTPGNPVDAGKLATVRAWSDEQLLASAQTTGPSAMGVDSATGEVLLNGVTRQFVLSERAANPLSAIGWDDPVFVRGFGG
jgi:hypothetical protein